jgi:hypothetical protein
MIFTRTSFVSPPATSIDCAGGSSLRSPSVRESCPFTGRLSTLVRVSLRSGWRSIRAVMSWAAIASGSIPSIRDCFTASTNAANEPAEPSPRRKKPRPSSGDDNLPVFGGHEDCRRSRTGRTCRHRRWSSLRRRAFRALWPHRPAFARSAFSCLLASAGSGGIGRQLLLQLRLMGPLGKPAGRPEQQMVRPEFFAQVPDDHDRAVSGLRLAGAVRQPSITMTHGRPFLNSSSRKSRSPMKCWLAPIDAATDQVCVTLTRFCFPSSPNRWH